VLKKKKEKSVEKEKKAQEKEDTRNTEKRPNIHIWTDHLREGPYLAHFYLSNIIKWTMGGKGSNTKGENK